jgi:pyruvate/2-oxoglutarate dehydrogenase complex dihydrolipoamide dehydrogenase (E3) component
VFVGGGLVGCEEGINAAKYHGSDVTIVEITDTIASGATHLHRLAILSESEKLQNLHVRTLTECVSISEQGVAVKGPDGRETFIEADTVVFSVGMKPLREEAQRLYGIGGQTVVVGDCKKPGRMNDAVTDGYFAGYHLQKMD